MCTAIYVHIHTDTLHIHKHVSSYLIYTHAHVHTDADTDTHTHTISHGLCEYKADSRRNPNSSKSTAWLMQVIEVDAPGYLADQQGSIDCSSPTTSDRVSPVSPVDRMLPSATGVEGTKAGMGPFDAKSVCWKVGPAKA